MIRRHQHHHGTGRHGLTLLEVVVSLALFVTALASISQLVSLGTRSTVQAALKTDAAFRAESKLAEILAGVESLEATSEATFEDDPRWTWSLASEDGSHVDLVKLTVSVVFQDGSGAELMRYSVSRYTRDPQMFLDAADAAAEAEAEEGGS